MSREQIELIKDKLDVVTVIGNTINLTDIGNGKYTGAISPGSKSGASLHVDQKIQSWYDFATGTGGDVLEWIAKENKLNSKSDFPEIIKIAADIAGIEIKNTHIDPEQESHKRELETLMTAIAEYYHSCLTTEHKTFITNTWGISGETINRLKIGYAIRGNQLIDTFKNIFHEDLILETGLVYKFDTGNKDLFQGRIIFPYWKNGHALYFIGRQTEETPNNKYEGKYKKQMVHSTDRPYISVDVSNQYFYGEDTIRGAEDVLITEGVTDCIMAMQNDIPCISPVTTTIKKSELERAHKLIKNAVRISVCNDNDDNEAGQSGALTTAEYLHSKGVYVRLVELPKGEGITKMDLAEYLRDNPKKDFMELVANAKSLYRAKLSYIEVDTDPVKAVQDAIKFVETELKNHDLTYIYTFIRAHIKEHFGFTAAQIKDIISTVTKKEKKTNKENKIPLTEDRIRKDAEYNSTVDIPVPYCLKTVYGDAGTFKHSITLKESTGEKIDVYEIICQNPTWIDKSFIDPITGKHYLDLVFKHHGTIISKIVSQKELLTTVGLKNLTEMGLNVAESRTKGLADYFSILINESSSIKECEIFSKFGWVDNNTGFVIGEQKITSTKRIATHLTSDILAETTKALTPRGTIDAWLDASKGLLKYDNVKFVCYTAATAMLLKIMNGASFVVELVGDTSLGKTITAQLAISCIGDPDKLKMATSATKTFIERTCATCNDLPIYLDETSAMQSDVLKEIIYMVESGTGRGRAKKDGGVNDVDKWKSVLITTGEAPLTNMASLGGQDVRIVSIYGGIGAHDPESVEYFKEHMTENYGVLAPLLIEKIIKEQNILKESYEKIRAQLKQYSKKDQTGAMNRIVDTYSLIALAGFIFESVMEDLNQRPINAGELVVKMFCEKLTQSDGSLSDRAFSIIKDWITENRKNFCVNKEGDAGNRYDLYGNMSMQWPESEAPWDYVDIIPNKLNEILDKKLNHPGISRQILREWAKESKIETTTDGRPTILATIKKGSKQGRVVRLKIPLITEEN